MIKNNLIAIGVHIVITVLSFIVFLSSGTLSDSMITVVLSVTAVIAAILYFFSGKLLKPQRTKIKSVLSVSAVPIILLIIVIYCTFISINAAEALIWAIPLIFNVAFNGVLVQLAISYILILIGFYVTALFPAIFLWLGILSKKSEK